MEHLSSIGSPHIASRFLTGVRAVDIFPCRSFVVDRTLIGRHLFVLRTDQWGATAIEMKPKWIFGCSAYSKTSHWKKDPSFIPSTTIQELTSRRGSTRRIIAYSNDTQKYRTWLYNDSLLLCLEFSIGRFKHKSHIQYFIFNSDRLYQMPVTWSRRFCCWCCCSMYCIHPHEAAHALMGPAPGWTKGLRVHEETRFEGGVQPGHRHHGRRSPIRCEGRTEGEEHLRRQANDKSHGPAIP